MACRPLLATSRRGGCWSGQVEAYVEVCDGTSYTSASQGGRYLLIFLCEMWEEHRPDVLFRETSDFNFLYFLAMASILPALRDDVATID